MPIVRSDWSPCQFERLYNLDENPLKPVITHLRQRAVCRLATGAPSRRHQTGIGCELVTRPKAIDRTYLGVKEQCAEDADPGNRGKASRCRIQSGGPLHLRVKTSDFFRQHIMQME